MTTMSPGRRRGTSSCVTVSEEDVVRSGGMVTSFPTGLPAVVARDVSKTFRMPEERVHTLKERVLHPRRRDPYQTFRALDDISFAVERGEFFGIAGRNGSGKSTLLKCIAGIYGATATSGAAGGCRRSSSSASASTPTWRRDDNVVMNGIMMGLSPREARKRVRQRDRVRGAARVPGPQAQELLVGDARPAGVLGRDPGRRRHAADRRGARGRRRGVPAEVLRRLQRDARRRARRSCS